MHPSPPRSRERFAGSRPTGTGVLLLVAFVAMGTARAGEVLPNGIRLPDDWPPRPEAFAREEPVTPPYLLHPPPVLPIDVGRQLFVDDFLVEETTLVRTFHQPRPHPASPVLRPETAWEHHGDRDIPFAAPFSDGVWHDPRDGLFKMWYLGGTGVFTCYATSTNGLHWTRPTLDTFRRGSNILDIQPVSRDSSTVWLDLEDRDPARRFKMIYYRSGLITRFSADGIAWSDPVVTHPSGDRTTMFYDPFRKVWVYSVRNPDDGTGGSTGLAILRRDGFASMDAGSREGTLTTRPLRFAGRHLFVNIDCPEGELRVEVLDQDGQSIPPLTRDRAVPLSTDQTMAEVRWNGPGDLALLAGRIVRFRFHLRQGRLYAFWVSPDESGASHGYVATGGPGYTGHRDTVGRAARAAGEVLRQD